MNLPVFLANGWFFFLGVLFLVSVVASLRSFLRGWRSTDQYKCCTKLFLILLRFAIGWHFLIEGLEKNDSVEKGLTETNRPWSSEGYLREANGPLGNFFRDQAGGDPDEHLLARVTLKPLEQGADPSAVKPYTRMPPALDAEWDQHLARFKQHFAHVFTPLASKDLPPEETKDKKPAEITKLVDEKNKELQADVERRNQRLFALAESKLQQSKEQYVNWLLQGKRKETRQIRSGPVEIEKTTPERVKDYREKVKDVRDAVGKKFKWFGQDVEKEKYRAAKAELAKMRADLQADVNEQTAAMKRALEDAVVLDKDLDQWPARMVVMCALNQPFVALVALPQPAVGPSLAVAGLAQHVPEPAPPRPIERIDWLTRWGLVAVGFGLLLGLFTRTACLGGAAFLLLVYCTTPPLPWLPENLRVEGHYLFVNKNLIEMLALMALATMPSGRWAGLDALLQFLQPRRWRIQH